MPKFDMVTQASQDQSRTIRQQLGLIRRRINEKLGETWITKKDVDLFDADELKEILIDHSDAIDQLEHHIHQIQSYNRKWTVLISKNPEEGKTRETFIKNHGEYLNIRIRQKPILISADIEKAFLQLELHIEDRDATRFLWIDTDSMKTRCFRYKRVPFGLKSSPFLLNKSVKDHLQNYDTAIAGEMADCLYVDNVYIGVDTTEQAEQFYRESKQIFEGAQMNLTQFVSNSKEANQYFSKMENAEPEDRHQKLLGVKWDIETDELLFNLPQPKAELVTKRKVLKRIAECYDPTGILTPVTLVGKLFFQTISSKDHDWDTQLSETQHKEWQKIIQHWKGDTWHIPRRMFQDDLLNTANNLELHVFTDASKAAYGTVAYLRIINQNHADAQFLMAKSRVAPSKANHTIPQLEALALVTGVRLANYCIKETRLPIKQTYIWSDSMCTLDSLQSAASSGNRFIRNRIKEVLEKGEDFIFTHVAGKSNPADLLTRGTTFENLKTSRFWLQGPEFLRSTTPLPLRKNSLEPAIKLTTAMSICQQPMIDTRRFSSFHRLLRTVMVMIHFITFGKSTEQDKVNRAKKLIYRLAQSISPPSEETIYSLQLQKDTDDDLWIYTGRVEQRPLIFLPQGHIAQLMIMREHQKNFHTSPAFTLTKLREQFWIPHGLSYVKKTLKHCQSCQKINIKPYHHPKFASFPDIRVQPSKPFEHTAVDFAGPLNVLINNVTTKVWIILYTCIYSRFVSTELITDMTASTFLHSLRRLSSLYGTPRTIFCDNAKQFHVVSEIIKSVKDQMLQSSTMDSTSLPNFRFITPHSPWSGGVYERMIGLVKNSLLRAGTTTKIFDFEDLKTTLQECTGIVNCRPLTYISVDENITPLRPVDFVFPHGRLTSTTLLTLPQPLDFEHFPWKRRELAEGWEQLSTVTDEFRSRWNKEYIEVLQCRKDFEHKQKHSKTFHPNVGDVVLICQPGSKSTTWPLGRILEVKERSAILKNGKTKRIVEYPWKLLCPLETAVKQPEPTNADESSTAAEDNNSQPPENTKGEHKEQSNTPSPPLRRTARKRSMPNYFVALSTLALITGSTAENIETITSTTTSTPDYKDNTWNFHSWIILLGFILVFYGLHGILSMFLCFHCICNIIAQFVWNTMRIIHQGFLLLWNLKKSTSTTIVILLMVINGAKSCNEVASFQATDDVCIQSKDGQSCSISKVVSLSLRPDGNIGCFKIWNNDKKLETLVNIQPIAIVSTCNEKTHHFTRQFKINHAFSHRCSGAGSCKGDRCEKIKKNEGVAEFSDESMSGPGFTTCYAGCGWLTCDICFSTAPSCLFSRLFAEPTSFAIYEIVECPIWSTTMEVRIGLNGNFSTHQVHHGIPFKLHQNISIIITGFSMAPAPIHGATFIKRLSEESRAVGYSLSSPALVGRPSKGKIGELQCGSLKDANEFNCIFAEEVCTCEPTGTAVSCNCEILDIETLLIKNQISNSEGNEGNIQLLYKDGRIISKVGSSGIISLQLKLSNYTIHRINKEDNCSIIKSTLSGCHSCGQGADINFTCKADKFLEIEATIECTSIIGFINCSVSDAVSTLKMFSSQKEVVENCTISCGQVKNNFSINGTLSSNPTFINTDRSQFINSQKFIGKDNWLDTILDFVESVWNRLFNFIWEMMHPLVLVAVLVLVIMVLLRCRRCGECRRRRKRYIRIKRNIL